MHQLLKASTFVVATLLGLALTPDDGSAQKNCKKGIPCGRTCISVSKTCHVGTAASDSPAMRPRQAGQAAPVSDAAQSRSVATASLGEWVGSSRGHTYYRAGCSGASKLAK